MKLGSYNSKSNQKTERTGDKVYIFWRGDMWYPMELWGDEDAIKNAIHNKGTTKVEDSTGRLIWTAPTN